MRRSYTQELTLVRTEYEATKLALSHIVRRWNTEEIIQNAGERSFTDFQRALSHIDVTYIVRLFATFEGLLRHYVAANPTEFTLPKQTQDIKVGWFVDGIAGKQSPRISVNIRKGVYDVRDCRNDLMHTGRVTSPSITFYEALTNLAKYLDKLPPPR